jgi:hypothetical protein
VRRRWHSFAVDNTENLLYIRRRNKEFYYKPRESVVRSEFLASYLEVLKFSNAREKGGGRDCDWEMESGILV